MSVVFVTCHRRSNLWPSESTTALRDLLQLLEDWRVPELKRLRISPGKVSGRELAGPGRTSEITGLGAGRVDAEPVPAVKPASSAPALAGVQGSDVAGPDRPGPGHSGINGARFSCPRPIVSGTSGRGA